MSEAEKIINFLEEAIKSGADKAYLSSNEYALFEAAAGPYSFRRYRNKTNPKGKFRRKLTIMVNDKI